MATDVKDGQTNDGPENSERRLTRNFIPSDRGMSGFRDFLRSRVGPDEAVMVDRIMGHWSRLHGNRVIENPTKDYAALLRTYRGLAALGHDGRLRTTEVVRLEDVNLFHSDERERVAVLSETKWNDAGQFLVDMPSVGSASLSKGTWLDSDGSTLRARCGHAMRAMTLLLNSEFRYGDCPGFLESGQGIPNCSPGNLRRMTPEAASQFEKAWEADIACYMEARQKFLTYIDPQIIRVMTHAKIKAVSAYNWLRGTDAVLDMVDSMSRARVLLVNAFPLMHEAFRDNGNLDMQDMIETVAENVKMGVISNERDMLALLDDRQDMVVCSALGKYYGVQNMQVLNFRSVRADDIGVDEAPSSFEIRNLLRTSPMFPGDHDVDPGERRKIIRASFLTSAFEQEISKYAEGVTLTSPEAELDEDRVKDAIKIVGDVGAWLTTTIKVPIDGMREANGSRATLPNMLGLTLTNTPIDVAADRILNIHRISRRLIDSMRVHHGFREPMSMEWASMFKQPSHFLSAGRIRVLTNGDEIERLANRMDILLPSAAGRAFSSINNYVEIADQDGELAGLLSINPETLHNSAGFESENHNAPWVLRRWAVPGKEDVIAGCINNIRQMVSDNPDIINLRYLRAERNERMATLGEMLGLMSSETDPRLQMVIYSNGIDWRSPRAVETMLCRIEEFMPDGLRGFTDRETFLSGARAYEREMQTVSSDMISQRMNDMNEMAAGGIDRMLDQSSGLDDGEYEPPHGWVDVEDDDADEPEGVDCRLDIEPAQDQGTPLRTMLESLREQEPKRPSSPSPSM